MAPTEILAVQHYLSAAAKILAPARIPRGTADQRDEARRKRPPRSNASAAGEAQLVVGTHALLEDQVEFARLGLVIVDEQHRFGVLQRKRADGQGRRARRAGDDRDADPAHAFAHALRRPRHFRDRPDAAGPHAHRNAHGRRGASARRVGISAPRNRRRAPGLRRLSGDRAIEVRRIAALVESRHRGIRAAFARNFSQAAGRAAARAHEERGERRRDGTLPPPTRSTSWWRPR